jgi:hypothetical protein
MQPIDGKPANRKMALFLGLKVALKFEKKKRTKNTGIPRRIARHDTHEKTGSIANTRGRSLLWGAMKIKD